MHTWTRGIHQIWLMTFLLAAVMAGCGREQTATTTTPTLSSVSPKAPPADA